MDSAWQAAQAGRTPAPPSPPMNAIPPTNSPIIAAFTALHFLSAKYWVHYDD